MRCENGDTILGLGIDLVKYHFLKVRRGKTLVLDIWSIFKQCRLGSSAWNGLEVGISGYTGC